MLLTLRDGADDALSRGPDFSIGCVHGVKQQPVLIPSLQHQWLAVQDGDTVPLLSEKKLIIAVLANLENPASVISLSRHI